MHLKRLEISGFKSFADKTVIEFVPGVTAVVGPNGSGKSNITEAIRWVLGEQSAKSLRGGRMNDIIFAGSETRKPLNIAEVTLVLDNEDHFLPLDFSEISITRRLHRSGESDFYMNKQACRLKDIVELFMDSGLGRESFSIISQGKVESIFNSKPEERRSIFEEAAGVLKYKTRKKKAEQKLFETEDNLNRIQDIIYELEDQIEPLREQSTIAKDYLEQKEALTKVETALLVTEIEGLKEKWQESELAVTQATEELVGVTQALSNFEAEAESLTIARSQADQTLDELQAKLLTMTQELEKTEGQKNVLLERSKNTAENEQQFQQSKEAISERIAQSKEQEVALRAKVSAKIEEQKAIEQQLTEAEKELRFYNQDSKAMIEELRGEYVEKMQQQTTLKNELTFLERQFTQMNVKNEKSDVALQQVVMDQKQAAEKLDQVTTQLETTQSLLVKKQTDYRTHQTQFQKAQQQLAEQEKLMYDGLRILQQAKARKDTLAELDEDHAGFYQGVREILKNKQKIGGIVGAVAELIEVPKNIELAIDIALGAAAQNIVVKDEASGRKAISYLKEKRLGRATFLPITTIKNRALPDNVRHALKQQESFVGVASELVRFQPTVQSVVSNLLGTTIIATDLVGAGQLAKFLQFRYRIVTLEGDVMNPGGSMTGGASKKGNQGSVFARKNELTSLTEQIAKMTTETTEREKNVRLAKQLVKKEELTLEELRVAGEAIRIEEQQLKSLHEQLAEKAARLERELKAYHFEHHESQEEVAQYHERKQAAADEMAQVQQEMSELDQKIKMLASESERSQELQEKAANAVFECKAQLGIVKEQRASLLREKEAIDTQIRQAEAELEMLTEQLNAVLENRNSHQFTEEELTMKLEQLTTSRRTTEMAIQEQRETREALQQRISEIDRTITAKNNEERLLLERKSKAEIAMNRCDVDIENRLDRLREEYYLSFDGAKTTTSLEIPVDEARQKVKLLKRSIEELGTVNLGAIEEFDRVNERFTFLSEQKEDLLTAKASLFATMEEMDEEVEKRFAEVFYAIKEKFSEVFPAMFGGGHAELVLTNPEDLLNTGIDIIAQPPGKKLQSLSLLSGGERAFTAIALLFSIIQVRPVPFCILDEVEAALDEANVARFGRYLNQFNTDTQFIVITHRKGTMEEADVLYGVTMQESGVSKIVSVRLEEVEQDGKIKLSQN
ncbi:chromosome segregation protein SMC [Isobaculum melis]|uniref:Chromosome partition protein Smc n=1 Tax=Isobaculum melis TaxID=142588 RepID=A0A1H9RBQ2_9LACT|nr:chromosome segregation protein SMC [Isobaculum melis]SER70132.1 condensin subunit Smc [Isobaculum melis]